MIILFLGISLALFISLFPTGTIHAQDNSSEVGANSLYKNPELSYELNYPTDWDLRKYSKNTTYIRHGNDAFLAIVSSVPNEPTDLNSVSNNTIDQLEVTYGSIESNKSILSNVDSRILYYNMSDEIGHNRTVMEELALKNGKIYALYYMANPSVYSTYLPIIKNMLQSFKIIDMLPYEDATLGIKINYPSNWNKTSFVRDLVAGINFTSSSIKPLPNDNVSISISRIENIPPKSISEIVNQTIDKYKETLDDFSLLFNTSSDDKSNMMLFSYKDDILGTMGVLEYNTIHGKWLYSLKYKADNSTFTEYLPIISRMLGSFQMVDFLPYEDPAHGIKIAYPSNWKVAEEENGFRLLSFQESEDDYRDNLLINVTSIGNHSLSDQEFYATRWLKPINMSSPYTTTVLGYPAKGIRAEYLQKNTDRNLTVKDIITIINHRKYELMFFSEPSSYNIYLPTIQNMISSIKMLNFSFYQNPNLQFNMSVPSDWKIREDAQRVKFTSAPENQSDKFREYLTIRSPKLLSGNTTLESYLNDLIKKSNQSLENFQYNRNYSGIHTNFTMFQYNFTSRGEQFNALGVFPKFNNELYQVFFVAKSTRYQSYLPTINYTINSFKGIDFSSYRDQNPWVIKYPSQWLVNDTGKKVQFISPLETNNDIFQEHLDITYTLSDSHVKESIGCSPQGKDSYDLDLESEHKVHASLGNPDQEKKSTCSYSDGVNNLTRVSIFMKPNESNAQPYLLEFYTEATKYESYLPTIKYMISSFKIFDAKSHDKFLPFDHTLASIKYPLGWNVTKREASMFSIQPPANVGSVSFSIIAYPPSLNLEDDVGRILNIFKQNVTDFKLIKSSRSTLSNHTSYEIVYSAAYGGKTYIEKDIFLNNGELGYQISYAAEADNYDSYLPVINNMIDSLIIKPTGKNPLNPSGLVFDSPIIDLAVNPQTHKVYLSSDVANKIYVLDELTGRLLSNITVEGVPNFVTLNPSANKIFVVSPEFNKIYVINGYTDNISSIIQVGNNPQLLALDPNDLTGTQRKGLLFVANQGDNNVEIIDASNETSLKNVTVGNRPYGIVVNPVTTRAYVSNSGDNTVSVIDYGFNNGGVLFAKVIATVNVQSYPAGIAVDPYRNHIFVANHDTGSISVIDGLNNKIIKNVPVGIFPQFLLFNKNTSELYITEEGNNTISVMNMSQSPLNPVSIPIGGIATDVDTDTTRNWIAISSYDGKSLSFINGSSSFKNGSLHHNDMVYVSFNVNPSESGQIKCNGKIVRLNVVTMMDLGTICTAEWSKNFDFGGWSERLRNNVLEFSRLNFENSTYVSSNNTIMSNDSTIKIEKNSILTANFHHIDSFIDKVEQLGPYISTSTLIAVIVLASLSQYLFRRRRGAIESAAEDWIMEFRNRRDGIQSAAEDWIMDKVSLITIDASVIVGVLVFLSLEGFSKSQQTQVTLVTANIVFPFAISAIFSVVNHLAFGTRLMVAGFVNLMVSIIIIAIIKL